MSCQVSHMIRLRPLEVYQTAIQMMYDLTQEPYSEQVAIVGGKQFLNYDVLILVINPQPPEAVKQLQIMHCVAALYEAVKIMTEGIIFCQLRCHVMVYKDKVGALSITPWDDALRQVSKTNQTNQPDGSSNNRSPLSVAVNRGQVKDPEIPSFVIKYHFFGKPINSKSVSTAILEAMTALAPFPKDARFKELSVLSPDAVCAIIIDSVPSNQLFTYRWATRALKILYQVIVVPQKRWGDVYLELRYNDETFGELRMLKGGGGGDSTAVAW